MIILRHKRYTAAPIMPSSLDNGSSTKGSGWGIVSKPTSDEEATNALGLNGLSKTNEINNNSNALEFMSAASQAQNQLLNSNR